MKLIQQTVYPLMLALFPCCLLATPRPSVWCRDPDVGSVQPGEAALRLVRQLPGGCEGLPGPQALPAQTGIGHRLPDHVQLLA